jgi:hypothetical protein
VGVRLVLIYVLGFTISIIFTSFLEDFKLLNYLVAPLVFWYMNAYSYMLYRQLRVVTPEAKQVSMLWVWVVAAIGGIILVASIAQLAMIAFSAYHRYLSAPPVAQIEPFPVADGWPGQGTRRRW